MVDGDVVVHEWVKQAVLLWFRVNELDRRSRSGRSSTSTGCRSSTGSEPSGARVLPGAAARFGSYLGNGVVLMPSYVNIGAYVDDGTMVDTWATVGSCAQIGKRVHLAGGVGIGGVLEPPQAKPVVIEDDVFIGSRCMIVGGARVRQGAALGAGVILTASIPVIDAQTGEEISRGDIPERGARGAGLAHHGVPRRYVRARVRARAAHACRRAARRPAAQRSAARARHRFVSDRTTAVIEHDAADLFGLTAALCAVPSVSGDESALAGAVETRLRARADGLTIDRIANNVVARTAMGRPRRIVLGGHLDTVPVNGNAEPRFDGDILHGLGSADMKGGLAGMLALAELASANDATHDLTFVWYEGEEVADEHNGLRHLFEVAPDLLAGDMAILLEPTGGWVEAGLPGNAERPRHDRAASVRTRPDRGWGTTRFTR